MNTIKYSDSAKCPKCGGMLAYDARMVRKLPIGFGFEPNSARFQVDYSVSKGWRGECMNCNEQVFAVQSTTRSTCYPRSINRKLELARP